MNEIIQISVSVSASSVTRQGFNSILLVGDETMVNTSVFTSEHMVRSYTSSTAVGTDCSGDLKDMINMAFGQSPGVSKVYVSYVDTSGTNAGITTDDLDAISLNNNEWFGYASTFNTDADIVTQVGWINGAKKYGSFLKKDTTAVAVSSDYSVLWHTKASGSVQWVNVAWLSAVLALVPGSYTGAFQGLQIAVPSQYTKTEEDALRAANLNQYSEIGGIPLTWNGITAAGTEGHYADLYIGALYLEIRMQEDLMNLLANASKIPFTDEGIAQVKATMSARLQQSTDEGYLDAARPFTVTAPKAANVDRAARLLPNVSFEAFASGAIQSISIQGFIDAT